MSPMMGLSCARAIFSVSAMRNTYSRHPGAASGDPSPSRKGRGEFDRLPCRQRADALDHGEQAVGAVGAQRLGEAEAGDGVLDVDRQDLFGRAAVVERQQHGDRSEEHTSELQSLMRISYAVFCLQKKN